jgi:hypothetical protein
MIGKAALRLAGAVTLSTLVLLGQGARGEGTGPEEDIRKEEKPDFRCPFLYSLSGMAVGFGLLYGTDSFDSDPSVENFKRAFTEAPVWDDDSVVMNFVLHPLWGSETYLRAREAHFGIPGSIAFSMGMSVTWEYLIESWADQPSIQDLIFTTGLGWPLGELRYRLKQKASPGMVWLIDPVEKTLEHFRIVGGPDRDGRMSLICGMSWTF